jgi:ADP-heptose:LPS heptosyltransferase
MISALPGSGRDHQSAAKPRQILVILLSEMGSLVLAGPMFNYLQEKYPGALLHVLLFEKNIEFLEILDLVPRSRMYTVDGDSLWRFFTDSIRVTLKMRRAGIDTVIDCELFTRISSLFSYMSGAKIRVGFHPYTQEGLYRGGFINRPVLYNPYHHISSQFISLAKAIESEHVPKVKTVIEHGLFRPPVFQMEEGEEQRLKKRLAEDFPQMTNKRVVLIYPSGGLLPIRAWPLNHFCIVAEHLLGRGYAVCIIGMQEDRGLADSIKTFCKNDDGCINLTGYTKTVRELMVLFHRASLLITNDGGPGHFASMTPIPTIILYGPETPTLYGSLDGEAVQLFAGISCSPCLSAYNHRNSPCDGDNVCLKSITPEAVLVKAYELLGD